MKQIIKKKFKYNGIDLMIVEREEPYMNSGRTVTVRVVVAPNGGFLPIYPQYKQTLKSIVQATIELLDNLKKRGADVEKELTKEIIR